MNDSDIKIYGDTSKTNFGMEFSDTLEAMNHHRQNGNIEKAKHLGKALAALSPTGTGPMGLDLENILPKKFLVQDVLYQIKVLIMFAAEAITEVRITYPQLAATAINAMYDTLSETSPGFYRNLTDGSAFSFYYLAARKNGDMAKNIGDAFAMLCNVKKNTDDFSKAGEAIWKIASQAVETEVEKAMNSFEDV